MATAKLLANSFKKLKSEPIEGFAIELEDESNLFEWTIWVEGPKDTLYDGGIFKMKMTFPTDFPMIPPELKFISDFWHPNIYAGTGVVCISILHPPGEDEMSGERADERWLPTRSVGTILLSVISMLSQPNFSSPANVDASVEWQRQPEIYTRKIKHLVEKSIKEKPSHVVIPHPESNPEERQKFIAKLKEELKPLGEDDFVQDDMIYDSAEEEECEEEEEEKEEVEDKKSQTINKSNSNRQKLSSKKGKETETAAAIKKKKTKKCIIQ